MVENLIEGICMFEISVKSHFSSAHHLKGYRGACRRVHGHNWEVTVFLRGARTNSIGMLVDFGKIKAAVRAVLKQLDHRDLNRLPAFKRQNPTSENLAQYVFQTLAKVLRKEPCAIHRVLVSESPGTSAGYWEDASGDGKAERKRELIQT
jgi:6-pyruvoyltetrahydropterin/6-carboxytetrahydropterin synthase